MDFFFSTVTHIGEETFFLVLALFFFWCVNKRKGYFMLCVGLIGTVINQALKLIFRIPRPWVKDPSFEVVGDAKIEATGYSFPSGHTQNVAGTFGSIARSFKSRALRILSVAIIVLVAFSRMYLGVHTPLDVTVSLLIAFVLVFCLYPLFSSEERLDKLMPYIAAVSFAITLALVLFVFLLSGEGIDHENLASGRKNASTLIGCISALPIIYYFDKHFTKFKTDAPWYSQILKLAFGLLGVLAIKSGLSQPLVWLFGNEYIARGIRYFLIVIFAGAVWPISFKFFSRMKISAFDSFGEKLKAIFKGKKTAEKQSEDL